MKKMLYIAAVMPALVLSCNKENQDNTVKETVLTFGIQEAATKTDLAETRQLRWSAGDVILVEDVAYGWHEFTLKTGAGETAATFSAPGEITLMNAGASAWYMASNPTWVSGHYQVLIPSAYEVDGANIKVPMQAFMHDVVTERKFQMMTGALKVDVYDIPATADRLVVTANRKITGTFDVLSGIISTSGTSSEDNVLTLSFTPGESQRSFCIPLPACADGYSLSLSFRNGSDELAHKSATIPAVSSNSIMYAPAFSLGATVAETVIWRGPKALGYFGGVGALDENNVDFWKNVKLYQTVTIYFQEDDGAEYPGSRGFKVLRGDWSALSGIDSGSNVWTHGDPGDSYSFVINDDRLTDLTTKGMVIQGYYVTITKITLK